MVGSRHAGLGLFFFSDPNLKLGKPDRAQVVRTTSRVNVRDLVMMGGMAVGTIAAANLLPAGVSQAALLGAVVGGFVGRELGWLAQVRMPSFQR